jgi:hypothetical protein
MGIWGSDNHMSFCLAALIERDSSMMLWLLDIDLFITLSTSDKEIMVMDLLYLVLSQLLPQLLLLCSLVKGFLGPVCAHLSG